MQYQCMQSSFVSPPENNKKSVDSQLYCFLHYFLLTSTTACIMKYELCGSLAKCSNKIPRQRFTTFYSRDTLVSCKQIMSASKESKRFFSDLSRLQLAARIPFIFQVKIFIICCILEMAPKRQGEEDFEICPLAHKVLEGVRE